MGRPESASSTAKMVRSRTFSPRRASAKVDGEMFARRAASVYVSIPRDCSSRSNSWVSNFANISLSLRAIRNLYIHCLTRPNPAQHAAFTTRALREHGSYLETRYGRDTLGMSHDRCEHGQPGSEGSGATQRA